ncbi:S1 family peptidase [Merismopedia glauca]|uniref:Serine protease n=1 Tax=Merismopedia glauca CCAP 1448/3 TaxID=1296344 RepID=A0A2T1BXP6_9CYAN|nr:serine protease [Merismopedia glauca]PSB00762.1 serine protease [Merismopedia glauca CCAP 1448/3]
MLTRYLLPTCLVGAAIVTITAPSYGAEALLPTQVAKIAKYTAVRIEPTISSPGSGVVIGRYNKKGQKEYVILTAAHVVKHLDDEYQVISPWPIAGNEREKIKIDNKDIQILPGLDLALIKFCSDRDYQAATIGDSDTVTEGSGVYVAGFPDPGAAIKRRVFQFTGALVSSRLDGDAVQGEAERGPLAGGYAIIYTNVTRAGMSGGPVFDVAGRLVGIHGMGDREFAEFAATNQSGSQVSSTTLGDKTGFNLAIPVKSFLSAIPNRIGELGAKYDGSEVNGFIASGRGNVPNLSRVNTDDVRSMKMMEEENPVNDRSTENSAPTNRSPRRF